ncbi:hypothetical protein F511_01124 [Dorcoceras hygrometricum]|nr:hypothetical protein F511_01124 [Dorcoceras hygrometricum]
MAASSDAVGDVTPNGNAEPSQSALIFLGTGCSSAVPNAMCLIQPSHTSCHVCSQSLSLPPERNPNYRCNTSLLIDYCGDAGEHKYILIDVGKTFREQVLRWFTFHKIPLVDSIILTHEHADAILGLDDIRSVQPFSPTNDIDPTPIYLSQYAMESIAVRFPYLVQKKPKPGQEVRRVAQLDWRIIDSDCSKTFVASGLQFFPLPVSVLLYLLFYLLKPLVPYMPLVVTSYFQAWSSTFSDNQFTFLVISKHGGGQLDLLILDTLYKKGSHNTHFCFPQTLDAVKKISPKKALLVGMTHEFDHHKDNEFLMEWSRREGISVQLAYDGLRIPITL